MTTLYLDIFSGISGDMFLGALLDLGLELPTLERELSKLGLRDYHLHVTRAQRGGMTGTRFEVHIESGHAHARDSEPQPAAQAHEAHHDHRTHGAAHAHPVHSQPARTFADIRQLILASSLSDWVKRRAVAVFQRLAEAEGKIHGQAPDQVHFHEVGAVDSIVDIVGAAVALEQLGRPQVWAAPVVEGTGWIECAHGRLPLPAPATLEILSARAIPVSQCDEPHELVTPTGAALLAEFVERFGPMQGLTVCRIGYGLGHRDHHTRPNVLRVLLCEAARPAPTHDWETDTVAVLQTNLDDLSPELLGAFISKALGAGALDVFYTPVQMKKNRPGVLLTLLCAEAEVERFSELILRETSAFGLRHYTAQRFKLRRRFETVSTPWGPVTVKLGLLDGQLVQAAPEFASCQQVAEQAGVPLKQVYDAALQAARAL
jgi:uncharacterized protein (TIGR00299 family) protein